MSLKLKTAEERAAEIRAESQAIEAKQAAEKTKLAEAKAAGVKPEVEEGVEGEPEPDYAALAREEEKRAAQLKQAVDEMQLEIDPSLAVKKSKVAAPHVDLAELLNKHDNAEDTLNALHNAIRKMREEPGLNEKKEVNWPSDLSHLTESQRARTLAEMEAGKRRSEAAADQQAKNQKIRREQAMKEDAQRLKLADLQAQLEAARATIDVLRHNPVNGKEQFPTIAADKVVSVNGNASSAS
jgi:hypothetical protein